MMLENLVCIFGGILTVCFMTYCVKVVIQNYIEEIGGRIK